MERSFDVDRLHVAVYDSPREMSAAAAAAVSGQLRCCLENSRTVRVIFAAARSQDGFASSLVREDGIDWGRVEILQLDEYAGLGSQDPRSLRRWLETHVTRLIPVGAVEYMNGAATDLDVERRRYGEVVGRLPIDVAVLGIGENGHLAFNDPHVADFDDQETVRLVQIDETSRLQQVHDGAFAALGDVPSLALTVTIPPLLRARSIHVVVPGQAKATAVDQTLHGGIAPSRPASVLRTHPNAVLYLDSASFAEAAARRPAGN